MLHLINLSPPKLLKKAAKTFPLTFSMEHLLHRLYGVDAPEYIKVRRCLHHKLHYGNTTLAGLLHYQFTARCHLCSYTSCFCSRTKTYLYQLSFPTIWTAPLLQWFSSFTKHWATLNNFYVCMYQQRSRSLHVTVTHYAKNIRISAFTN